MGSVSDSTPSRMQLEFDVSEALLIAKVVEY